MYGTIARVKIDPAKLEELKALGRRMGAPGQIARYVFQMDADPGELYLIAVFESRETYWANAKARSRTNVTRSCALMSADPEWHDGEIVDVVE